MTAYSSNLKEALKASQLLWIMVKLQPPYMCKILQYIYGGYHKTLFSSYVCLYSPPSE